MSLAIQALFEKQQTFTFNDRKHYDLVCFKNKVDLGNFNRKLKTSRIKDRRSTWYGHLAKVVTMLQNAQVLDILKTRARWYNVQPGPNALTKRNSIAPILAILPALLLEDDKIVGVFQEYACSVSDLYEYVSSTSFQMFNINNNPTSVKNPFTIFVSVRLSHITHQTIRSLHLQELMSLILDTVRRTGSADEDFDLNLAMCKKDAEQTGMYQLDNNYDNRFGRSSPFASNADLVGKQFVNVITTMEKLDGYVRVIHSIDPLVIDAVVYANDSNMLGQRGRMLKFNDDETPKSISKRRSLNAPDLKLALEKTDTFEIPMRKDKLNTAVRHLVFLFNVLGMDFECPVKYVRASESVLVQSSDHLYKVPSNYSPGIDRGIQTLQTYQSYSRAVRSLEPEGYKVKLVNFTFWFIFIISFGIAIAYGVFRNKKAALEDILQTTASLLTIIITASTTVALNTMYKGEALFDIITNMRKIDTQDEFDLRGPNQTSDIIEVLRITGKCPTFLGGGPNTSFVRQEPPKAGLQSRDPMPFTNLEVIGYALFECAKGWLFMIDPWNNVFKVSIIDNLNAIQTYAECPEENDYRYKYSYNSSELHQLRRENRSISESSMHSSTIFDLSSDELHNMTLFFTPLEVHGPVDRYSIDYSDGNSTRNDGTEEEEDNFRCIRISPKGTTQKKYLSRVLPYQSRGRCVGVMGRYSQLEVTWARIKNRDLYSMNVGIPNNMETIFESDDTEREDSSSWRPTVSNLKNWTRRQLLPSSSTQMFQNGRDYSSNNTLHDNIGDPVEV